MDIAVNGTSNLFRKAFALSHRFTINFESEFKTVVAGLAAFKLYNNKVMEIQVKKSRLSMDIHRILIASI